MNTLKQAFGKTKTVVFFDLEGSQLTHEMIAIGAIKVSLNSSLRIKKYYKPFLKYVKCKSPVGNVVSKLTGISDEKLKKDGHEFFDVMEAFKKYVGMGWKNAIFISFGGFDIKIIHETMNYTFHAPKEICTHIIKHHFDFQEYICNFIKSEANNSYSLVNYCKLFDVETAEPAHSPDNDAINLARLYDAFLANKHIVKEECKKTLTYNSHLPAPILQIMTLLRDGHDVSQEQYDEIINKYIDD